MDLKDIQQSDTVSNGQSYIGQAENAFYYKHREVSFISKKTEKIATAIYMVTDFLSDSEPLKTELRTLSLSLVSITRKLLAGSADTQGVINGDAKQKIEDTLIFLDLAQTIGIISEMNGVILRTELTKLKHQIEELFGGKKNPFSTHPGYANIILSPEMFSVERDIEQPQFLNKGQENNNGHIKNNNVLYKNESKTTEVLVSVAKKNDLGNKIARRNDVLTVVRNKGKVSIKDISQILKDIGDKTLQRELHGLVQEGVLIKEGEKRWSMYRIAN
jgi:hypothetical protein